MNFWIVKGNKKYPNNEDVRDGRLREMLEESEFKSKWATKKAIPEDFKKGDGVFYWSSSPDCYVIGLGEVVNPDLPFEDPFNCFLMEDIAGPLDKIIDLATLRENLPSNPNGGMATFLKRAVAGTIYPLTEKQSRFLARIISDSEQPVEVRSHFQRWRLL
jgi:hypothetical protein